MKGVHIQSVLQSCTAVLDTTANVDTVRGLERRGGGGGGEGEGREGRGEGREKELSPILINMPHTIYVSTATVGSQFPKRQLKSLMS